MNKEQRDAVQRFLAAAADEDLELSGVDAADLYVSIFGDALPSDAAPQEPQGEVERERGPIDANALERMAKVRLDECFLKGSGVLKLTGAIRQLEAEIRALRAAAPAAQPATPDAGYVPLTDDKIAALRKASRDDPRCVDQFWFVLFARAIEREVLSRVQAVRKPLTDRITQGGYAFNIVVDPSVPKDEIHLRNPDVTLAGKITGITGEQQ